MTTSGAHHSLLKVFLFCILSFYDYGCSGSEWFCTFDIDMQLLKATSFVLLSCRSILLKKFCLQIFRSVTQSRWNQYLRGMGISKKKKKVHFSILFFFILFLYYFSIMFCIWYLCKGEFVLSLLWDKHVTATVLFVFKSWCYLQNHYNFEIRCLPWHMTDPCFQVNSVIAGAKCILHCISFKKTLLSCLLF